VAVDALATRDDREFWRSVLAAGGTLAPEEALALLDLLDEYERQFGSLQTHPAWAGLTIAGLVETVITLEKRIHSLMAQSG